MRRMARSLAAAALLATLAPIEAARSEEPDYASMLLKNQSLLSSPPKSCDSKTASLNNFELQQCSAVAFTAADKALNQAYAAAIKDDSPERSGKLQQAQRHWLAFRNAECDWEALAYAGGSLEPVTMGTCLVEITKVRTRQLRAGEQP